MLLELQTCFHLQIVRLDIQRFSDYFLVKVTNYGHYINFFVIKFI